MKQSNIVLLIALSCFLQLGATDEITDANIKKTALDIFVCADTDLFKTKILIEDTVKHYGNRAFIKIFDQLLEIIKFYGAVQTFEVLTDAYIETYVSRDKSQKFSRALFVINLKKIRDHSLYEQMSDFIRYRLQYCMGGNYDEPILRRIYYDHCLYNYENEKYVLNKYLDFDEEERKFEVTLSGKNYTMYSIEFDEDGNEVLHANSTESPDKHIWRIEYLDLDVTVKLYQDGYLMCPIDGSDMIKVDVQDSRYNDDPKCVWAIDYCWY